jgi:hypothetical protein
MVKKAEMGRPVKNKHKVAARQWRKWSREAQNHFNDMMEELHPSMQGILAHPEALTMHRRHWEHLRFNISFLAADKLRQRALRHAS